MKRNKTLVEIPFTSNAQILGVADAEHPFEQYFRKYGVAVAFSTDDEGVSHADYTDEWLYAVGRYRLTFSEAVKLARASLQYSFLPGASLWQDDDATHVVSDCAGESVGNPNPGKSCTSFLAGNLKAGMQWRYEAKLAAFEKEYGATLRTQLGSISEARR
jgi:adenosine deaminase